MTDDVQGKLILHCDACRDVLYPDTEGFVCASCWDKATNAAIDLELDNIIDKIQQIGDRIRDGHGDRTSWWTALRDLVAELE